MALIYETMSKEDHIRMQNLNVKMKELLDKPDESIMNNFSPPTQQLIDNRLREKIRKIYNLTQSIKCDWWTVIIGGEGTGKSTLADAILWEYSQIAGLNFPDQVTKNTAFDEFDVVKIIADLDLDTLSQFIWVDEGANTFFNRESGSGLRRFSIKFSNTMRFLQFFVVICSVELSQLDTIIRNHRIKSLIRIQEQGIYHYYNYDQISKILSMSSKMRDRQINWRLAEPEFVGWFKHSPETQNLVNGLKRRYLARFQVEAKKEIIKRLAIKETREATLYKPKQSSQEETD